MVQFETIKKRDAAGVLQSYWQMLQECEEAAFDSGNILLKHNVEQWYLEWNRITGSNNKPKWSR